MRDIVRGSQSFEKRVANGVSSIARIVFWSLMLAVIVYGVVLYSWTPPEITSVLKENFNLAMTYFGERRGAWKAFPKLNENVQIIVANSAWFFFRSAYDDSLFYFACYTSVYYYVVLFWL